MIQFNKGVTTNTVTVYPESSSVYATLPASASEFTFIVSQSYNLSLSQFNATLINTPTFLDPRLTFEVSSSVIPSQTGQYDVKLRESKLIDDVTWGTFAETFTAANTTWAATRARSGSRFIDTDRAWIVGSDEPVFTNYTSSNEQGTYSTYNG